MVHFDTNGERVSKIHNFGSTASSSRTSRRMGTKSVAVRHARKIKRKVASRGTK